MEITYLGHSCFKLKGKKGVVITDPFDDYIGLKLPSLSADLVTVSHEHKDHNAFTRVKGTTRRKNPFIINKPGAYEVGGISVFGTASFHDENGGVERGANNIYTVMIDNVRVCHLGDLGHELSSDQVSSIGSVDVLLVPVGGVFTINPKQAIKIIKQLDPAFAIPMHFRTSEHDEKVFGELATLENFINEYGVGPAALSSLKVEKNKLPEETELVILKTS